MEKYEACIFVAITIYLEKRVSGRYGNDISSLKEKISPADITKRAFVRKTHQAYSLSLKSKWGRKQDGLQDP